jgi:hypothetical protein
MGASAHWGLPPATSGRNQSQSTTAAKIIGVSYSTFAKNDEVADGRPFVWMNGRMYALPGVPRNGEGTVVGINNRGQIIGHIGLGTVLWTPRSA